MQRQLKLAAIAGLVGAAGVFVGAIRPGLLAQDTQLASGPPAPAAHGEAKRARERAALLDRQARSASSAADRAKLALAAVAARIQQTEAALALAEADLERLAAARRRIDAKLAAEAAPIAGLLAGLQAQGRLPPLMQLLYPRSTADTIRLRATMSAVEPQIAARTVALRNELGDARRLENEAMRIAVHRQSLQKVLIGRRNDLAALSAAERLKAQRASSAADREVERAFVLAREAQDPGSLLGRIVSERKSRGAFARDTTGFAPAGAEGGEPYRLPVQGYPHAVQLSRRGGLTLEARPGSLVVAPGPGRVAFAGPYRGFGNIVILEHGEDWTSLLTGLDSLQVIPGQTVVVGSPLGFSPSANARITIELRRSGLPVDASRQLR